MNLNKIIRFWKSCVYKEGMFRKGWVPPHPTFFVRRNIYAKYGMFDLDYTLAADFEIMLRFMARHNITSVYIPKVLVKMRIGGSTNKNMANIIKQNREIYRAGIKNEIPLMPFFVINKTINRLRQYLSKPPAYIF